MHFELPLATLLVLSPLAAQNAGSQPSHYQAVYTRIYADDVEAGKTGNVGPGLQLPRGASVTTDPSLVISGKASIHILPNGVVATNSATVNMAANTVYIGEPTEYALEPDRDTLRQCAGHGRLRRLGSGGDRTLSIQPSGTGCTR